MNKINKNPGIRIICEYCGRLIIGHRIKYCCRSCKDNHQKWTKLGPCNPMYGKVTPDEVKLKQSASKSGPNNPMYGKVPWNKGIQHTEETRVKMSTSTQRYYDEYEFDPTKLVPGNYHDDAIIAYGYQCCVCGLDDIHKLLEVHHIDGNHSNDDISNLVVLCTACHFEAHRDSNTGRHMSDINKEFQSKIYKLKEVRNNE